MAIITVLAAVAIPTFGRQLETARETGDMELIRSAYNEALTMAALDATDGKIDGANGATTFPTTAAATTPIHYTAGNEGAAGTYTVTFANMEPAGNPKQTKSGWEYIDKKLFGVNVTDMTNASTGVTFSFVITSNGNVALDSTKTIVVLPNA